MRAGLTETQLGIRIAEEQPFVSKYRHDLNAHMRRLSPRVDRVS